VVGGGVAKGLEKREKGLAGFGCEGGGVVGRMVWKTVKSGVEILRSLKENKVQILHGGKN